MSRIPTPATIEAAPKARVSRQVGSVPNLFRPIANSPASREGFLGLVGALGKGALPAVPRERVALAVVVAFATAPSGP
jgi:alkylhydroperoxidase family enzyme